MLTKGGGTAKQTDGEKELETCWCQSWHWLAKETKDGTGG